MAVQDEKIRWLRYIYHFNTEVPRWGMFDGKGVVEPPPSPFTRITDSYDNKGR
jgi:hypothetical protein